MARPRKFDETIAITAAMNVFWEYGYEEASIARLLDGMGMTKGSLYKAFKDKKTLFLMAMTQYETTQINPVIALLRDGAESYGHVRIQHLFSMIPEAVRQGDRRGCLLCSAAAGPSFVDAEIAEVVDILLARMRAAFVDAIHPFVAPRAAQRLARALMVQYVGLRVLARAQTSAGELQQSADAILALLPNGPKT